MQQAGLKKIALCARCELASLARFWISPLAVFYLSFRGGELFMDARDLGIYGWLAPEVFYLRIVLSDLANKAPCKNSDCYKKNRYYKKKN